MTEKKTKYDTNPLDPEPARKAAEVWGQYDDEATRHLPQRETAPQDDLVEDAPTRRYDGGAYQPYPSPYQPGPPPPPNPHYAPPYQTPPGYEYPPQGYAPYQMPSAPPPAVVPPATLPTITGKPTSRPVAGLNLPENLLLVAPYIPMYIGAIAGLIELFITPREEKRVRFHAAQGLAMQLSVTAIRIAITLATVIGGVLGGGTGLLGLFSAIFSVAVVIYFILYLIKVWKGQDQPVEALAGITAWLEEHIAPRAK